jgi:hypothetical protein
VQWSLCIEEWSCGERVRPRGRHGFRHAGEIPILEVHLALGLLRRANDTPGKYRSHRDEKCRWQARNDNRHTRSDAKGPSKMPTNWIVHGDTHSRAQHITCAASPTSDVLPNRQRSCYLEEKGCSPHANKMPDHGSPMFVVSLSRTTC